MKHLIYRVSAFEIVADYTLRIRFDDESEQTIDFRPILMGELYGPLRDVSLFNQVRIDPEVHTLVWPNGAGFDPAILHDWPENECAFRDLARRWDAVGPSCPQVRSQMNVRTTTLPLAVVLTAGCMRVESPKRPSNVPKEATLVGEGKVRGWWQRCTANSEDGTIFCSIWNKGGLVLYSETFLPYDQGPAVTADELQIQWNGRLPGPDRVCLLDGRILVPHSKFEKMKRLLDWSFGKAPSPY